MSSVEILKIEYFDFQFSLEKLNMLNEDSTEEVKVLTYIDCQTFTEWCATNSKVGY